MISISADGWLVPGQYGSIKVFRHPQTPKTMPLESNLNGRPLGMVWHWTGGGYGSGMSSGGTEWNISASADPAHKSSWHFFINRAGEIHQFAPASIGTWATGGPGLLWTKKAGVPYLRPFVNVNNGTVAVELQNAGVLLPSKGAWYGWPYGAEASRMSEIAARDAAKAGRIAMNSAYKVDSSRAVPWADGNVYDRFTDAQIFAAQELARALAQYAGWNDPEHIHYGHRSFYSKRDPGLLWMDGVLPTIERNIFGRTARTSGAAAAVSGVGAALVGAAVVGAAYYFSRRRT